MKSRANLRLMMLFLAFAAIVLAYDHLPKMTAVASKLAAPPTRLNVISKPGSAISEAMAQPPVVIPVTNTNDSGPGSLRAAIAAAQDGDTVNASGITGTITLSSELAVSKSITITGPAAGTMTVSGNSLVRVFNITASTGDTVTMSRLTISNGFTTGGDSTNGGGGIHIGSGDGLTLDNCTVSNNSDGNIGGAGGIGNFLGATLTLTNCVVSGNAATGPSGTGGIRTRNLVTLTDCTISDNTASGNILSGGITSDGTMTLTNCTLTDNTGPAIRNFTRLTLAGCTLTGNMSSNHKGGAIFSDGSTMELDNCTLSNNTASQGGAIYNNGFATLTNCILDGNSVNSVDGGGGAIFNNGNSLVLTDCTLTNNQDNGVSRLKGGGAIHLVGNAGPYSFTNCTFSDNYTNYDGGAIRMIASATITNCTFFGNRVSNDSEVGVANSSGAAVFFGNRTITITNSTFTGNSGGLGLANAIAGRFGGLKLTNSIVAGNPDGDISLDADTIKNPVIAPESALLYVVLAVARSSQKG